LNGDLEVIAVGTQRIYLSKEIYLAYYFSRFCNTTLLSGIGFILTGNGGVCAAPTLYWQSNRILRLLGAFVLIVAALIWAFTGYLAYWGHLADYSNWAPPTTQ